MFDSSLRSLMLIRSISVRVLIQLYVILQGDLEQANYNNLGYYLHLSGCGLLFLHCWSRKGGEQSSL